MIIIRKRAPAYVAVEGPGSNATVTTPPQQLADDFGLSCAVDNTVMPVYSTGTEFATGYNGTALKLKAAFRRPLTGATTFDINATIERLRGFNFRGAQGVRSGVYGGATTGTALSIPARTWTDPRTLFFVYFAVATGGGILTPPAALTSIFIQGSANFDHQAGYFIGSRWLAQSYSWVNSRENCYFACELTP